MVAYTSYWDPNPPGAMTFTHGRGFHRNNEPAPGEGPAPAAPGSSYNESFIPDYDEEQFLLELAKQAQQLATAQHAWGQQQYQRSQRLTNQLLAEANSYSSAERQRFEMGRAGARTAQAMEAQRENLLRDLESFGIDPSAGRYAGLIAAERTQQGAAVAGAENAARAATEATGRDLRGRAAQSQAQTSELGAQLMGKPDQWAALAASLRYPPLGSRGSSTQRQPMGPTTSGSGGGSGGGGGGRQGGGGGGGGRADGSGGAYGGGAASSWDRNITPGYMHFGGSGGSDSTFYGTGDDYSAYSDAPSFDQWTGDYGNAIWDQALANPAQDWWSGYSDGSAPSYDQWSGDYGNTSWDQASPSSSGGSDWWSGSSSGESPGYSDWGSWDTGASWDTAGYDFAGGGDVPTTGGHVDYSLSPSAGAETDDVAASLNAGEFVIPRDVAMWKGQEFFQNLITKSREARGQAPAKPTVSRSPAKASAAPAFQSVGA